MAGRGKLAGLAFLLLFRTAVPAMGAGAADAAIPQAELQALDRAIARELDYGQSGSQTLGDLLRLKKRLLDLRGQSARSEREVTLAPLAAAESLASLTARLENEAGQDNRQALRSLALFHLFKNEPEQALERWKKMGRATEYDLSYLLIAAYLEFSLGEYEAGRADLTAALKLMDARSGLRVSTPLFCSNIMGYRVYVPLADKDLAPGDDVLIYAEVDGAEFTPAEGGVACRLRFGLRLRDVNQTTLWAEPEYGEYAPVFSGPIRDLHVALIWRVPNDLAAGRYHLQIEAVDLASRLRGESTGSFSLVNRGSAPAAARPTGTAKTPPGPALPTGTPPRRRPEDSETLEMLQRPGSYEKLEMLERLRQNELRQGTE
ncbi:MAG: hypothetical protein LBU23_09700 [Planctomycetota bacterium]|jgi:hypothetical protein|nr:hypothetical protein [Planctomycetota bacterium]